MKGLSLARRFNAFRDDSQLQGVGETNDGVDNREAFAPASVIVEPGNEGAVDFDGVDGKLGQVGQGGVASPEIVNCKVYPDGL